MRPLRLARALLWFCLAGAVAAPVQAAEDELDRALERVIASRGLEPLEAPPLVTSPKFRLGQMLFFDPILSGTRDVACATCHLLGRGTSDGVALSVGVDAAGLAEERRPLGAPRVHPRNSMDLWNRGHPSVRNMFWDGRVSETDAPVSRFQTPMGDYLPDGIESVLAAQALLPLAGEEEMLGLPSDRSAPDLPGDHGDRPNEIALAAAGLDEDEPALFVAVHDALMRRLLGQAGTPLADWQIAYRRLIAAAYRETLLGAVTMGDLANAIGHFQELAFVTRDTPWDRYLAGDKGAIGRTAKEGALLFYGKARCARLSQRPALQRLPVPLPRRAPDRPRHRRERRRSRPLRGDAHPPQPLSVPHAAAPQRHLDRALLPQMGPWRASRRPSPCTSRRPPRRPTSPRPRQRRRASFTPMLRRGLALDTAERASLLAFLQSLEDDQAGRRALIVPERVPSGLPVPALAAGN